MLAGFKKVLLQPHDSITAHIPIQINQLMYYDENLGEYCLEPGKYTLLVGSSSREIRLTVPIRID